MELYDHKLDPNEWGNVAADSAMRGVVDQLFSGLSAVNAEASQYIKYPTNEYFLGK